MDIEWYKQRNKRTDALAGVNDQYKDISIGIEVTEDLQQWNTQVMLIATINILSRWCRRIHILAKDSINIVESHNKDGFTIIQAAAQLAKENDPFVEFSVNEESRSVDFTIVIGVTFSTKQAPFIAVTTHGWVVACSYNQNVSINTANNVLHNPLSSVFAACLVNAQAFRCAIGMKENPYTKWYSLYDNQVYEGPVVHNEPFSQQIDLHRAHIVGCGAIGSSFCYLLSLTQWKGSLTLIDMDKKVEIHNLSSSLLFRAQHEKQKKMKTSICKQILTHTNFKTEEFPNEFGDYPYDHEIRDKSADILLCFANDKNIWSTIQNCYPPVVWHATTSVSWGVNVGRHIPHVDECLACTFQEWMKTFYVPKCAEGELPLNNAVRDDEEKPAAILPFLSPAAAVLAMAEVYKLYQGIVSKENALQMNFSTCDGQFVMDFARPSSCPVCRDQHEAVYKHFNKGTLFSHLSETVNL